MDKGIYDTAQQGLLVCLLGMDHQERLQAFLDGLRTAGSLSEAQIDRIEITIRDVLEHGNDNGVHQTDEPGSGGLGNPLSKREQEVLKLVANGFNGKEIAVRLDLSTKTIETYKVRAQRKLGLMSRPDVIRYAIEHGWFDRLSDCGPGEKVKKS